MDEVIALRTDLLKQDVKNAAPWMLLVGGLSALTTVMFIEIVPDLERTAETYVVIGILSASFIGMNAAMVAAIQKLTGQLVERYSDDKGENCGS